MERIHRCPTAQPLFFMTVNLIYTEKFPAISQTGIVHKNLYALIASALPGYAANAFFRMYNAFSRSSFFRT